MKMAPRPTFGLQLASWDDLRNDYDHFINDISNGFQSHFLQKKKICKLFNIELKYLFLLWVISISEQGPLLCTWGYHLLQEHALCVWWQPVSPNICGDLEEVRQMPPAFDLVTLCWVMRHQGGALHRLHYTGYFPMHFFSIPFARPDKHLKLSLLFMQPKGVL